MNIGGILNSIGGAFQNFFYPTEPVVESDQQEPIDQIDATTENDPQNLEPQKNEEIQEHPTTGVSQSLINLATHINQRTTAQALESHQVVRDKTALMNKHLHHQELLRGIHENSEKDVYDYSQDEQIIECIEFLKEHGIKVPDEKTLSKSHCLQLIRQVEAQYKNTESEQKIALNTFHEHTQLRDRMYEILKSCVDMIRGAIQKASGHIGR